MEYRLRAQDEVKKKAIDKIHDILNNLIYDSNVTI